MGDGRPHLQVALLHRHDHPVQPAHRLLDAATDHQTAADAKDEDHDHGPPQGLGQARQIGLDVADVLADEQLLAARQRHLDADGLTLADLAGFVGVGQAEIVPAPALHRRPRLQRRGRDIAGDRLPILVHQQIEIGPAPQRPVHQGLVQGIDAARSVNRRQRLHLGPHPRLGPRPRLRRRGDIDIGQHRAGRRHEQRQKQQRQPKRRPPKEGRQFHERGASPSPSRGGWSARSAERVGRARQCIRTSSTKASSSYRTARFV
ncbi:hypothetical protein D3C71_1321980 [compost metagenome]